MDKEIKQNDLKRELEQLEIRHYEIMTELEANEKRQEEINESLTYDFIEDEDPYDEVTRENGLSAMNNLN